MKQIEETIQQYLEKRITLKETADKTIEKIYTNLHYFGLYGMDEDDRSDFITFLYSKLEQVIQSYDPSRSSFRTYLRGTVGSNLMTWTKLKYKLQAKEHAVEDYVIDEYAFSVADVDEDYCDERNDYDFEQKQAKIPPKIKTKLDKFCRKVPESTKLMVLALKSASFLKPSHIHKLHLLTGIDEEKILNMFLQLQGSLYRKKFVYAQKKEFQNKSYILKKKSLLLLEKTSETSCLYNSLKKALAFYDKKWRLNTERLKKSRLLTPSCTEVARILGLQVRTVRRIQQFAQEQLKNTQ